MLSPRYPAPVVAGNVETSQMITDALYGALGVMAAAQGTMNNSRSATTATSITRRSAAAPGPGPISTEPDDAVHTHMTNTRLTTRRSWSGARVLLRSFAIRRGSGGAGVTAAAAAWFARSSLARR